jgi:hypothetical protein
MTSMTRRATLRLAVLALPVAAVACIGGTTNLPTEQTLTVDSSSSTSGSGGGVGGFAVGLYKLTSFNGSALPDTIVKDSVEIGDSTRIVTAILDSAELQLDTDSTVIEKDYFQLPRDVRAGPLLSPPTPAFNLAYAIVTDSVICTGGTYIDTSAQQTSINITQQSCGTYGASFTRLASTYTIAGDSLTGSMFYQYYDSAATLNWPVYENTATLTWKYYSIPIVSAQHGTTAPRGKGGVRKARRIAILSH